VSNCFLNGRENSVAASTSKKVLIRRFDRESLAGFVNPQSYLLDTGIELISPQGVVAVVPFAEIKSVCFVREFDEAPGERRVFSSRPKTEGLWIEMRFRDGDHQEGLLPNDLLNATAAGFLVTPPDPGSNVQRLFVPRQALTSLSVLGVVGSAARRRAPRPAPKEQIRLFE
jgi:hypothetical protein